MKNELSSSNAERPSDCEILEVNINQLEDIVPINHKIFRGMYEQDPYSLEYYKEKLKGLEPKILVAKINGHIVGDSISFNKKNSLYIWIMGVLEEYRNKGIATKFFENSEQFARINKYESVTIKVYNVSKEMLRMLSARGYQIMNIDKSKVDTKYDAMHLELKF